MEARSNTTDPPPPPPRTRVLSSMREHDASIQDPVQFRIFTVIIVPFVKVSRLLSPI